MKGAKVKVINTNAEITQDWKSDPVKYKKNMTNDPNKRATPPGSKIGPNVQKDR